MQHFSQKLQQSPLLGNVAAGGRKTTSDFLTVDTRGATGKQPSSADEKLPHIPFKCLSSLRQTMGFCLNFFREAELAFQCYEKQTGLTLRGHWETFSRHLLLHWNCFLFFGNASWIHMKQCFRSARSLPLVLISHYGSVCGRTCVGSRFPQCCVGTWLQGPGQTFCTGGTQQSKMSLWRVFSPFL